MNDLTQTPTQLVLFDYDSLDSETRIVVQQRTTEIKQLIRESNETIAQIGEKVAQVRDKLRHNKEGGFEQWLQSEFRWSKSTAYNLINASNLIRNRPMIGELGLDDTVLYELARPSTPDTAIDEVQARVQGGEPVNNSRAKDIIIEHKQREEAAAEEEANESQIGDDGLPVAAPTWLTSKTDTVSASTTPSQTEARTNQQLDQLAEREAAKQQTAEKGYSDTVATQPESKPAESESKPAPIPPPPPPKPKPAPPPGDWHLHATIKYDGNVLLTLSQVGNGGMTSQSIHFHDIADQIRQLLNDRIPADQLEKLSSQAEAQAETAEA